MTGLPKYKAAWWLRNPHLQSMWCELFRKKVPLSLTEEEFELGCGDFLELQWVYGSDKNTVIVLHGLGGSIRSSYIRGMVDALNKRNFNVVAFHFRGCSKKPNRNPQAFHAGQTSDLKEFIESLKNRYPEHRIFVVGFSLGGNILLKYLGENKESSLIHSAVAISVPFLLKQTQISLSRGFSQIYQYYLLTRLKYLFIKKFFIKRHKEIDLWSVLWIRNFNQFDQLITAPLHGFKDAEEYYMLASSKHYLRDIKIPTLIIQSEDDPFYPKEQIPDAGYLSPSIEMLITKNGGHVGFVAGDRPTVPEYWLEEIVPTYFLNNIHSEKQS
jgi:uncharacterized protein